MALSILGLFGRRRGSIAKSRGSASSPSLSKNSMPQNRLRLRRNDMEASREGSMEAEKRGSRPLGSHRDTFRCTTIFRPVLCCRAAVDQVATTAARVTPATSTALTPREAGGCAVMKTAVPPLNRRGILRENMLEFLADWEESEDNVVSPGFHLARGSCADVFLLEACNRKNQSMIDEATNGRGLVLKVFWPMSKEVIVDSFGNASKKSFPDEVGVLSRLRPKLHPNLIDVFCFRNKPQPAIVTERISGVTFESLLEDEGTWASLPMSTITRLLADVTKGLMYMHDQGIVHGDIRPRVLVLDKKLGVAKISDFACATVRRRLVRGGSAAYLAPEATSVLARCYSHAKCCPADPTQDWYAMGMVVLQMVSGRYTSTLHSQTLWAHGIKFDTVEQYDMGIKRFLKLDTLEHESPDTYGGQTVKFLFKFQELVAVYAGMTVKMTAPHKFITAASVWIERARLQNSYEVAQVLESMLSMDPRDRIDGKILLELLDCHELWTRVKDNASSSKDDRTTSTDLTLRTKELLREVDYCMRPKRSKDGWWECAPDNRPWWSEPFKRKNAST